MKIILQKEVEKLGVPGDVVTVADGYARNFLVPRGMAIPASKGAVRHVESLRRAHGARVNKARGEAQALADRLSAIPIKVTARAGEEGRLFGSITTADLAEEIAKQTGQAIDRRDIHLDEPIRSLGTHEVSVRMYPEVNATLSIQVEPEA
ncbi:MAG TPA: 50S ribosomal protein L9 [Actinomycetota bacterium]